MEKDLFFSIHEEMRKACDGKRLDEALNTFLENEESMLCVDPEKRCIKYQECREAPFGTYYFFQNYKSKYIMEKNWYGMNANRPFLVIEVKPLPDMCPLQPGKHLVYLCDPATS